MVNKHQLQKSKSASHLKSNQILRIGLAILGLSILWYLLAPRVAARRQATQLPLDVDRRLEAVKRYEQDKTQNSYEYETDKLPLPLAGDNGQSKEEVTKTPRQ